MFVLLIIYLTVLFVVFCFCISISKKTLGERHIAREEVEHYKLDIAYARGKQMIGFGMK